MKITGLPVFSSLLFLLTTLKLGTSASFANETVLSEINSNEQNATEQIMYSYSEAVVENGASPRISQLTIAKGNDGKFHYVKNNPNGTVETGNWNGPLPSAPNIFNVHLVEEKVQNLTSGIANRLAILNESIGKSVNEYLRKALMQ